ncbi:MAG: type II toxin-antitoxin system PemK/MazF family toxin [Candidatus Kapabacteria bacterium]|nr:type II toxin-antitoxin system PemK/MazF family toxin [Ignavibacteriota bacterium]MCW5885009.1 type II toxin-antitoxin system PemK/MazF family toxin [Candidatus Kapabacteria bacterium]
MQYNEYKQGDICLIDFNPTIGDEIKKIRPAIIINGDFAVGLELKIVAPITSWKNDFEQIWWLVNLKPSKINGLDNESAVNCYQLRCVSTERIIRKIGYEINELENIIATSQNCIEIL